MSQSRDLDILLREIEKVRDVSRAEARDLDAAELAKLARIGLEAKQILASSLGVLNDFSRAVQSHLHRADFPVFEVINWQYADKLHALVRGGANQIHRASLPAAASARPAASTAYIAPARLAELRGVSGVEWDLSRLVRLLEELNISSHAECHMATAMLVRAVVDHIPPIFGQKNFEHVSSNVAFAKSVKSSFQRLQGSLRHIADAHLHVPVRASEILPTAQQVDFRQDLDVVLAEVVRVLK